MVDAKLDDILSEVRSLDDCLAHIKVNLVEIFEATRNVRITMICDKTVSEDLARRVLDIFNRTLPQTFKRVRLNVKKIVSDEDLVRREILGYIKSDCKSVAYSVKEEDIQIDIPPFSHEIGDPAIDLQPRIITFKLSLDRDMADIFERQGNLKGLENFLDRSFCDEFRGEIVPVEKKPDFSVLKESPAVPDYIIYRTVKVKDIVEIDPYIGTDTAVYIEDINGPMDSVFLSGEILSIRERVTVQGKPYYLIEFSDRSEKITGTYFNKKSTENKIRRLKEGDGIIIQGSLDYMRDRLSLTIKKINLCAFPKDFAPERKPSKPVPPAYVCVFPEGITEYSQGDFFTRPKEPHPALLGKTFVVFDFETTGKEPTQDAITEIGAVKIENGVITQKFTTLINPGRKIPPKITELTGIDDAMVADKPRFSHVSGDIYRFFNGAILVAHNIDFDYKFLKRQSEESGYLYYNKGIDTVQFARDTVKGLNNYKLDTVCEHFGIGFNHHRALDDAYATAQMFIKLVELSGGLPKNT